MKDTKGFYGEHYSYMETARKAAIRLSSLAVKKINTSETRIISRIKSPESMSEKIESDGLPLTYHSILQEESDAIGVRIITSSLVNVYDIQDKLKKMAKKENSCFKILKIKDFIKKPKESGYRSLHMIIAIKSNDPDFSELKVEIQIRTAIMDCWATLEHMSRYKQVIDITPEVYDMLDTYKQEIKHEIDSIRKFA